MKVVDKEISFLNLTSKVEKKLRNKNILVIGDLRSLRRDDLKKLDLTVTEINEISIKLQLQGLDLNHKKYDK